jgi:hypothetical protein
VVEYLQIRHPPAFIAHVAGQHAHALGFDLAAPPDEEVNEALAQLAAEGLTG